MKTTLPEPERPEAVAQAAAVLEAREADLAQAEQAVREARVGLDAARSEDRASYASARNAGKPDPGPRALRAAEAHLEDAERKLDGERLRVEQAQAAFSTALEEHRPSWHQALEDALERADAASLKALDKFEAAEAARGELRAAVRWLRGATGAPATAGSLVSPLRRNASGDLWTLGELIPAVRSGIQNSTLEAERRREEERRVAEREAAEWRERRGAMDQTVLRG